VGTTGAGLLTAQIHSLVKVKVRGILGSFDQLHSSISVTNAVRTPLKPSLTILTPSPGQLIVCNDVALMLGNASASIGSFYWTIPCSFQHHVTGQFMTKLGQREREEDLSPDWC
jgi:hypothetical protein